DSFAYGHQGSVELSAAQWAMLNEQSPKPFFDRARQALQKALELDDQNDFFYQAMAELYRRQAEWRLQKKERPQEEIKQGLAMIEKALSINPKNTEGLAVKGVLYLLLTHSERDPKARLEATRNAK